MRNQTIRLVLGMVMLLGCCGAAYAIKPMVAAGNDHSIGLSADGKVYGWGSDATGQLGLGRTVMATVPQTVPGLNLGQGSEKWRVAAGRNHFYSYTVTVKSDGSVWAWGDNSQGQLGDGTSATRSSPVQVPGLIGVVAVAAGNYHTLALKADGSVWAWGNNGDGQLGDGTTTRRSSPVQVPGLTGVVAMAAGNYHSLALKSDGSVWAWGGNGDGQLGDGTTTKRLSPMQVPGLTGVVAVAAAGHTLALKSDGRVWAWGANNQGQLGDGTTTNRSSPKQIRSLTNVVALAAGTNHTLTIQSDGSVWAWGANSSGELGDGTKTRRSSPVQVPGLTDVVAVAGGNSYTIALKSDGSVWAWGYNYHGELGDGTPSLLPNPTPRQVLGLTNVLAMAAGGDFSVAQKSDGSVWVWGSNELGQLGDGSTPRRSSSVQVPGLTDVVAVAAGDYHTIAVKSDGSVWAWGYNIQGQLGDGTTMNRSSPVQVPGLTGVVAVAGGNYHTLALKADGSVWAWGNNGSGQLGDGATTSRISPVQVPGLAGVVAVAGGAWYTIALKSDGSVWAWGSNEFGQLGDGTTTRRSAPVQVPGLTGVVAVAAGVDHSLAAKSDGSVWAWGDNSYGQLGDGTKTRRSLPAQVPGLAGVVALAGRADHSLAATSDGSVWAWGYNGWGQVGDGTKTLWFSPVQVPGLSDVVGVAAGGGVQTGDGHSLAILTDGSVAAWGNNTYAELGDGTLAQRLAPVLAVNPSVDGFLNLKAGTAIQPPPGLNVPFFVVASGAITSSSASVSTTIKFNAPDIGKTGAVYVTAMVPAGSLSAAQKSLIGGNASRATTRAASATNPFTLIQQTPLGWQPVVNGQLIPYATGVQGESLAAQKILDGTDTAKLKGAQYCLGYGSSAEEMAAAGRMRTVASIPDPNATNLVAVSCILEVYVLEFYNTNLDHYFITANTSDVAAIEGGGAGLGWSLTGNSFKSGGNAPVCRFYGSPPPGPGPNSHFYTVDADECADLKLLQASTPATQKRWNFESLDFISTPPTNGTCPGGTLPIYRAYNNGFARGIDSNHRITSSPTIIQEVVTRGWKNEGVVMCAPI